MVVTSGQGTLTAAARGNDRLAIRVSQPIDRPSWNPTPQNRPGRDADVAAFAAMRTSLDAHEQQHRQIGEQQRGIQEKKYRALDLTGTGSTRQEAMTNVTEAFRLEREGWQADAQAAQSAIDPFTGAVLSCPAPPTSP